MSKRKDMQNDSKNTAATLQAREEELAKGQAVLAELESERAAAATAYASDLSIGKRGKVETADALETRARVAREAHAAAILKERQAELAQLRDRADLAHVRDAVAAASARIIEIDRALHAEIEKLRTVCTSQRDARDRALKLGREIGVPLSADHPREVRLDDVRVACGIAVDSARKTEGRASTPSEVFLLPVREPAFGDVEVTVPARQLCTPHSYEFATTLMKGAK
jgi:hypothetical protein